MATHGWFYVSLGAKCRLLFGLAVVLIIAAALFVPWYTLEELVHDSNIQWAYRLALLARPMVDPANPDWAQQQRRLDQWWSDHRDELKLPPDSPQLVRLITPDFYPVSRERLKKLAERINLTAQNWVDGRPAALLLEMPEVQLLLGAKTLAPPWMQKLIGDPAMALALRLDQAISPYVLDEFQAKCVRQMQDSDKTMLSTTVEQPGLSTSYRAVLGVRGKETEVGRRPLVGLIDVRVPANMPEAMFWIRIVIILAGLLAGFLAILVFYLITQKLILAPVRELKGLADRVAGGDLSARAAIATGDEYEELSAAFNNMLVRLERSREQLETINRSLDTRVGELAETNVALFESNRLKSEFLANVSHELRTPMTSIIGFADLLHDLTQSPTPPDSTRIARYAYNILTSGRMLLDLINDLLDLAKIEAGKVELHRSTFAPRDVCEALTDFVRPLLDKKKLTMNVSLAESLPMMNSDAGKLRQVLYNLLSNAIKYTPEGGTIELDAAPSNGGRSIRISVSDNGPGIAPEDREVIFEKFRQLDSSVTREHSGSGLGLPISRELCVMLGGNIRLESELGVGSTFIIELPTESPEKVSRYMPVLT